MRSKPAQDARVKRHQANTDERDAVRNNTGQPVSHSGPGLAVGPTLPQTTGRTPGARPPSSPAEGGVLCQPKSVQGGGDGIPAEGARACACAEESSEREALAASDLDDYSISLLIEFFLILDEWDRAANATKTM